ncbi:MAG: FxsA family protein [Burkholderiales bacterium]|nr:FxsA family protein [Burkholderiales bacterium]
MLELLATIWLAKLIGWWVLAWYIASAAIGVLILKGWRLSVALALLDGARQGGIPLGRLFWVLRSLLAALLFIFPGPISDVLGILLILPWPGHNATLGPRNAEDIIEGEFVRADEPHLDQPRLPSDQ